MGGEGFLITRIAYNGNNDPEYVGQAIPGSTTGDAVWQVKRITYDGNQNPTVIEFAGVAASFNQVWDDRASLTYG
ncbi:MAG: hypothetical protein HQL52_17495 [Magnetococcales bacterium]|nr:hypothetical protein [Magnetococcales bacterium]